jgi:6-pyruvoyl-tetrahydropterin synthase
MYTVGVNDHVMIARSLAHPGFGPAARLHGATLEVEVELLAHELDEMAVVVDIDRLRRDLRAVLEPLDYQNLGELPEWQAKIASTEALARHIHRALAARLRGHTGAELLRVRLRESPRAWAGYEGPLGS